MVKRVFRGSVSSDWRGAGLEDFRGFGLCGGFGDCLGVEGLEAGSVGCKGRPFFHLCCGYGIISKIRHFKWDPLTM